MAKRKKTARDMTTQELAKRLFDPKLKRELDKIAHEGDEAEDSESDSRSSQEESST